MTLSFFPKRHFKEGTKRIKPEGHSEACCASLKSGKNFVVVFLSISVNDLIDEDCK